MKDLQSKYPIILFSVLYVACIPFYLYQTSSDTVSYIAISENYAEGNAFAALNGYWSPLFSFLLIPFIWTHINVFIGVKIINLLSSLLIFYSFKKLASIFALKAKSIKIVTYALIPLLLWKSLSVATPDVLAAGILLFFLTKLLKTHYQLKDYIIIPLLGFVCYLSKYYNFYFIMLALITRTVFIKNEFRIKELTLTLALFMLVCCLWFACIYAKYNKFTPTTATAYNLFINGPQFNEEVKQLKAKTGYTPQIRKSVAERATVLNYLNYSTYRYTSWEDPSYYQGSWNPFNSIADIKFYISNLVYSNFSQLLYMFMGYIIALIALFILYKKKIVGVFNNNAWFVFAITIIYPAGYVLTHFESRYVLFSEVLIIFLYTLIIANLPQSKKQSMLVNIGFMVLAVIYSYQIATNLNKKGIESSKDAANKINNYVDGRVLYSSPPGWSKAVYIAYFNKHIKFHDTVLPFSMKDIRQKNILLVCKPTEVKYIQREYKHTELIYSGKEFAIVKMEL